MVEKDFEQLDDIEATAEASCKIMVTIEEVTEVYRLANKHFQGKLKLERDSYF